MIDYYPDKTERNSVPYRGGRVVRKKADSK